MKKNAPSDLTWPANDRLQELLAHASKDSVRTKLRNLHQVCRRIVCETKMRLSVPEVMRHYKAMFPNPAQAIAEQTIRNKRKSGNPYQSLYRKWEEVAEAVLAAVPKIAAFDAGVIGEHDIRRIEDQLLRHQVTMLVAQNRSMHNQINILKQSHLDVPIRVENEDLGGEDLLLSVDEIDAIRDFINSRKLQAKHLERTADDGVKSKDGRTVADPGFMTALEKIVRSYERE
jgi:hypothetical protein